MSYTIKIYLKINKIKGMEVPKNAKIKKIIKRKLIPPMLRAFENLFEQNGIEFQKIIEVY